MLKFLCQLFGSLSNLINRSYLKAETNVNWLTALKLINVFVVVQNGVFDEQ